MCTLVFHRGSQGTTHHLNMLQTQSNNGHINKQGIPCTPCSATCLTYTILYNMYL